MRQIRLIIAALLLISPFAANADPISYSGSNSNGFWDRPIAGGPFISGLGPVQYTVQGFFTTTDGLYDFNSTQNYDGYIHIYESAFDPLNQLMNLLAGDDDGPGGIGTSQILGLGLSANVQYLLVTSAFAAGDVGSFTNTIASQAGGATIGLGAVSVPEPGTLALLGIGLAGIGLVRRRKKV